MKKWDELTQEEKGTRAFIITLSVGALGGAALVLGGTKIHKKITDSMITGCCPSISFLPNTGEAAIYTKFFLKNGKSKNGDGSVYESPEKLKEILLDLAEHAGELNKIDESEPIPF